MANLRRRSLRLPVLIVCKHCLTFRQRCWSRWCRAGDAAGPARRSWTCTVRRRNARSRRSSTRPSRCDVPDSWGRPGPAARPTRGPGRRASVWRWRPSDGGRPRSRHRETYNSPDSERPPQPPLLPRRRSPPPQPGRPRSVRGRRRRRRPAGSATAADTEWRRSAARWPSGCPAACELRRTASEIFCGTTDT